MIVISDVHIGVNRSAGTTPASALALRKYLLSNFEKMLSSTDEHLVILGDLFDTYQIPMTDLLETYRLLSHWLLTKQQHLTLVCGNHDLSTDSTKLSSFQFLAELLTDSHKRVQLVQGSGQQVGHTYIIPHVANQDLFNLELDKVPECEWLLVHCNYDNYFAKESDHSLNLSKEQAQASKAKHILFAHEHHARTALGGKVVIPGNQVPSSVSDCLSDDDKYMTRLVPGSAPEMIQTWSKSKFKELDWTQLETCDAEFIRVVGTCKPEEAADMADAIARYRKISEAFVITNAVKVVGTEAEDALQLHSLEAIKKFDVLEALKKILAPDEIKILETLK